jgi:hypothetical protein
MHRVKIGIAAFPGLSRSIIDDADYVEIKKISADEVSLIKKLTGKPLFFHLQFTGSNSFYLLAADNVAGYLPEISKAYNKERPAFTSFHFGLSSGSITVDPENNVAVAGSRILSKEEIAINMEKNLRTLRDTFPDTVLLVENQEFIPDELSKGAYRYIQEADFFSHHVNKWKKMGILDGIVFDVAHALITAVNHPFYNDQGADPLTSFRKYIDQLPLRLIREIHISGVKRLPGGIWVDFHKEIGDLELKGLKIILDTMPENKDNYIPLTLEYSRDSSKITNQLNTLRDFCRPN